MPTIALTDPVNDGGASRRGHKFDLVESLVWPETGVAIGGLLLRGIGFVIVDASPWFVL